MTDPLAEIQKIEENIRRLEELKQSGSIPEEVANASIEALKAKRATYHAELQRNGAIAKGDHAKAAGERGVLADNIDFSLFVTGDGNEVNVGTQPRAKKESLRELYMSYLLEQVSPLAFSGLVRQSASEAETRMNLSAVYTALLTQSKTHALAAVEWDPTIAQTYRLNHPNVTLYEKDIRDVDPVEVMTNVQLKEGELTVLSACAPCQPFSRQNKTTKKDDRTKLVLEVLPFVGAFRPAFIVIENVPGLNKGKNKVILDQLITALRDKYHYKVSGPHIIDAVNYGIPQFRKRLILFGSREDIELSVPPTTYASPKEAKEYRKESWRTVSDAFTGIPKLASGQESKTDPMHRARKHSALNLERLSFVPKNGGGRKDLPVRLQLACHKNKKDVGYNDVYGRMDFSRPANTLTTGCTNITKGRYAHPTANRAITLREAARLQTFPDSYVFAGGYDQISVQIGNAVPVLLAEVFAKYILTMSQNARDVRKGTSIRYE